MAEPRYGTLKKDWGPHPKGKTVTTEIDAIEGGLDALLVDPLRFEALLDYGFMVRIASPWQPDDPASPGPTEESLRRAVAGFFGDLPEDEREVPYDLNIEGEEG
jgi:hypothetical protein